ncbi:MAG: NmrA family NAD(P)-binding protein [Alphaproteobacteria bacterium]|nr:NmrA family NAD(P)-binding protein [Alphaproteobacteria bacterium]
MRVLVTGAGGQTGRLVIPFLLDRGVEVRALATRESTRTDLEAMGVAEARIVDLEDPAALDAAFEGMDKVLHIPPAIKPNEADLGRAVVAAAVRAGASHFVLHSVVSSQIDEIVFHAAKREVEHALINSGLPFTILQPNNYMQNVGWTWERIVGDGKFVMPYSADTLLAWVDARDLAEALAVVLTDPGYEYGTFECIGTESPLTRKQMAEIISEELGRPVEAVVMPVEEYMALPTWDDRPADEMARVRTMFEYFDRIGGYTGNSKPLEMILGRKPRSYREFIADFVAQNS